ncbi:MAG: amidase [Myxococcota bacterium]
MSLRTLPALRVIATSLREQRVSCIELADGALAGRAASADPLGPYKTWDPDAVRRQAEAAHRALVAGMDAGPLHGIPISIKDLFGVQGWPTHAGTASRLPPAWEQSGPVVRAACEQLCVVMGKTHTVELAFGGLGTNPHWGTPRNPWDRETHRVPGGSSAGAGVSLLEGSALLALGTDTAGSVRIPASMTGTVGLKTSYGRWPTAGIIPLSTSLDSVGLLARTVDDAAFAFEAIERSLFGRTRAVCPRPIRGCRLGLPERFFWQDASPGVAEAVREAVRRLEQAGAIIVPVELSPTTEAHELFLAGGLAGVEVAAFLSQELPDLHEHLDPAVWDRIRGAQAMPAIEYIRRRERLAALSGRAAACFEGLDALVTPTVALSPPAVEALQDLDVYRRCNLLALRNTSMANLLSLCGISVPAGTDALGLPVGLQLLAPSGQDASLLEAALGVEAVLGAFCPNAAL